MIIIINRTCCVPCLPVPGAEPQDAQLAAALLRAVLTLQSEHCIRSRDLTPHL